MGLEEMIRLARALWAVAGQESEAAQVALAWLARNQIMKGLTVKASCAALRTLGPEKQAPARRRRRCSFRNKDFCRALAVTGLVWAGEHNDPTQGATLAHRHDEAPAWAHEAKGTALIGPWMFYRPR